MTDDSHISALERLTKLRDSGALTQEEFDGEKAKVMAAPPVTVPFYRRLWFVVVLTCLLITFPISLLILVTGDVFKREDGGLIPLKKGTRYAYAGLLGLWLAAAISVANSPKSTSQRWVEIAPNKAGSPLGQTASKNDDLACDSSDAIDTVTSIVRDNQPSNVRSAIFSEKTTLWSSAMRDVLGKQRTALQDEAVSQCVNQTDMSGTGITEEQLRQSLEEGQTKENLCLGATIPDSDGKPLAIELNNKTQELYDAALKTATYSLNTIRMQDRNATTGATACAAKLHVDVQKYGSAEEDIEYKLERTSDGKLFATVQGLQ